MKKAGCDGVDRSGGPGRFTVNYTEHFNWCRNESTEKTRESEKKARESVKSKCLKRKLEELVCADYAKTAVEASNQYQINRCTTEHHPTGRFSYKYNDHYNWCLYSQHGAGAIYSEADAREEELDACKQRNAESRFTPVKTLGVKRTVEDQSAEDDDSTKIVEAPARKHRTQLIVVGNRYVEVPAFDDDPYASEEGSRVGSVVKAGAAAVVVGTAAVATGVVAAKAVDYLDEHRDGIKEAAYGVKEKLKDRFEGGGGFDKIKNGTEALKDKVKEGLETRRVTQIKDKLKDGASGLGEKIKDRLTPSRSGGVSKVASGLKEKFKSRLSGGGGGLGSKMKGVAKAGGGLLRRLAGR